MTIKRLPINSNYMNVPELVVWLKQTVTIDEIYRIITGVDPCIDRRGRRTSINVQSIYGQGEDKRPSLTLDLVKNLFYCHRTNFGGDIFNLITGKKTIPADEFLDVVETLKNYAMRRGHRQHKEGVLPTPAPQITTHLIGQGIPKAWAYFKKAMEHGYPHNKNIKQAIEKYMGPKNGRDQDMGPLYDYTAKQLGWCDISNALVIPYGLNDVEMMELIYWNKGYKNIGTYPFKTHRENKAFQKMHTVNGDHSFFSGTEERPKVHLKPWPAGIGLEKPPVIDNIYGTSKTAHEILICEGVKDAITARFHGFYAITHHGGAFQAKKLFNVHNLFLNADGSERDTFTYVCMDSDNTGYDASRLFQGAFHGRKNKPIIIDIGKDGRHGWGYDLHDFLTEGFTSEDLKKYMKDARIEAGVR